MFILHDFTKRKKGKDSNSLQALHAVFALGSYVAMYHGLVHIELHGYKQTRLFGLCITESSLPVKCCSLQHML
jgi:hypothetical protein